MSLIIWPPSTEDVKAFVRALQRRDTAPREKTRMEEAIDRLRVLQRSGDERARDDADRVVAEILVNLGCPELVEEWLAVPKWQRMLATDPSAGG